jgi:hypothetical protein
MHVTKAAIEKHAETMCDAKPIDTAEQLLSVRQAIKMLSKEILQLKSRDYTWERIAEQLTTGGVTISTVTLKAYVMRPDGCSRVARKRTRAGEDATCKARRLIAEAKDTKQDGGRASFPIDNDNDALHRLNLLHRAAGRQPSRQRRERSRVPVAGPLAPLAPAAVRTRFSQSCAVESWGLPAPAGTPQCELDLGGAP